MTLLRRLICFHGTLLLSHQRWMMSSILLKFFIGLFRPSRWSQLPNRGVFICGSPVRAVGHCLVATVLVNSHFGSFWRHYEDVLDSDIIGLWLLIAVDFLKQMIVLGFVDVHVWIVSRRINTVLLSNIIGLWGDCNVWRLDYAQGGDHFLQSVCVERFDALLPGLLLLLRRLLWLVLRLVLDRGGSTSEGILCAPRSAP